MAKGDAIGVELWYLNRSPTHVSGKTTMCRIGNFAGDKVAVKISPYDLNRGRITCRVK